MPEITVTHIGIVVGALIIGVIVGWVFRGGRAASEKTAINEGWQEQLEAKNLDVVAMDLRSLDAATLERHYEEHVGKGFYADLVEFMSRGPVVAMVIEGPEDTWEVVRAMMGTTNPAKAAPGTIRGDFGILFTENLVHGSDSLASAEREIGIFFPDL